jgi:GNAT superfamily N-acetyltransferase
MSYRMREATHRDADVLVRHRIAMFTDMGLVLDAPALDAAFRVWLLENMAAGIYRAWLVEAADGSVAAGGGISILPWPPGPSYPGSAIAMVYNVYTEPAHRRRGLARLVMETIHTWAASHGISSVALNASDDGRPLYESMGYQVTPNPMMFYPLVKTGPA